MSSLLKPHEIEIREVDETTARIILEPLETGYGYTLGNALRRVLLSSIEGAAVTGVRITGIEHEYTVLDELEEDVLQILLNLKNLVISLSDISEIELVLRGQGPGVIRAGDIEIPANVAIFNKDLPIATLGKNGKLEAYITVSKGMGYDPADTRPRDTDSDKVLSKIPVDAYYSPIRRVAYQVEPSRHEERANLDRLSMTVQTNGTINARDAVIQAAKILQQQLAAITGQDVTDVAPNTAQPKEADLKLPIEEVKNLSPRTIQALKKEKINFLGDLVTSEEANLMETPRVGKKTIDEISACLDDLGLELGMQLENWPITER